MDDLFEKLKSEPAVNNSQSSQQLDTSELEPPVKKTADDISEPFERTKSVSPVFPLKKSRAYSPNGNEECGKVSPLGDSDTEAPQKVNRSSPMDSDSKDTGDSTQVTLATESPKKQMPTKAQQKLFETPVTPETVEDAASDVIAAKGTTDAMEVAKIIETKNAKVKRCRVLIKRQNLAALREKFALEQKSKKGRKVKKESPVKAALQKAGSKRKADMGGSPPTKKGKINQSKSSGSPPGKKAAKPTGFFIRLGSNVKKPTSAAKEKQSSTSKKSPQTSKDKALRRATSRVLNNSPVSTTKATKFPRSQLIRTFGKRYFNSRVRIERCRHPMMLTFESNARARKLQAKNKSKNLSVSFKEQVEIIGLSDTESYESDEVNATGSKGGAEKLLASVTPLHLKKVENGKVIDDIEFDPTLFGDPSGGNNASTPLRKKKEKKSYSPLKDDSSSSARSELLKSANEKLPPSALRRLPAEEEDDEDDECEWIVPIDIPERRSSRTNSTTEKDGKTTPTVDSNEQNTDNEITDIVNTDVITKDTSKEAEESAPAESEVEADNLSGNNNAEHVNGNEVVAENVKATENEDDKSNTNQEEKLSDDMPKPDFPPLLLENESNCATPNPPFTPENHCTPDLLVKSAIEKLSEDIEKSETDRNDARGLNNASVAESA